MQPDAGAVSDVTYLVDDQLKLVSVGGAWDTFALANGAPELVPPLPLGRPLFSFFADQTTVEIYASLFDRVARSGRPVSFPLRCDGPGIVRDLAMTVSPTGGGFLIRSVLVRSEDRFSVALQKPLPRSEHGFLRCCGWCKQLEANGRWMEIEDAVVELSLLEHARLPEISHAICPPCLERMESTIAAI